MADIFLQCQFTFSTHYLMVNIHVLIVAAFSSSPLFGKTSWPVKNSYLLAFPDDKADILAVCLFVCLDILGFVSLHFVIDCFDFLVKSHFIVAFS